MKKHIKKVIALLLSVVLTISLIACNSDKNNDNSSVNKVSYITRGEWIQILAKGFGLDSYSGEDPYYTDISSNNELYTPVQACYEWNILSTNTDEFKPNDVATLGYVVSTSVLAADLDYKKFATSNNINESIINCANNYGITDVKYSDTGELNIGVTKVEAMTILNSAISSYLGNSKVDENKCEYKYNDNVIDGNSLDVSNLKNEGSNIISSENAEKLEKDSIIIMPPTAEYPNGYAVKVVSKTQNSDGTYRVETTTPEIYEIFDSIDIDTKVDASAENFTPAKGVKVIENNDANDTINSTVYYDNTNIDDLNSIDSNTNETIKASSSKKFTLEVDLKNGQVKQSGAVENSLGALKTTYESTFYRDPNYDTFNKLCDKSKTFPKTSILKTKKYEELMKQYEDGSISTSELEAQLKKYQNSNGAEKGAYTLTPAFEAGYSLTGNVEVSMTVEAKADIDFHIFSRPHIEFNGYSVKVESDFNSNIDFKGKLEGSVTIGKVNIPIGAGFSVDVDVSVFAEVNGEIKYSVDIKNTNKIEYTNNKYKASNEKSCEQSLKMTVGLEMGFKATVYLSALSIKIVDVTASASALLEAESELKRAGSFSVSTDSIDITDVVTLTSKVKLYLPIIKLSVGTEKSLVKDLGLSKTFLIVGKSDDDPLFSAKEIPIFDESVDWTLFKYSIPLHEDETTTENETTTKTNDEPQDTTTDEANVGYTLMLSEFVTSVSIGNSIEITVTIPEGYSSNDLLWMSSDNSVATVVNGIIKGVSEGNATITVKTKDGKYKGQCLVTVD